MSEQKMREVLEYVREALQLANDSPNGGISDTIWMPHTPQTLFDFIDEALAHQPAASTHDTTGQAEFKAFHASLCRRFGYIHDENYWWRDLVSLQEHIAKQVKPAAVVELTDAEILNVMRDGYGCRENDWQDHINFARAIIAKQQEKGHAE